MKKVAILGSTGSIGTQTLDIIRKNKELSVTALSCGSNINLLEDQIREFSPKLVCVRDKESAEKLQKKVSDINPEIVYGMDGLVYLASNDNNDTIVSAVVGMMGIKPTIAAINAGKTICLANKETLVTAGHIIMPLVKEKNVSLIPVDSEHSAIFQSLRGREGNDIKNIILTSSGGPFRGKKTDDLKEVKVEDALKHPNWSMGRKITIDSATLINKGLEVIEAKWLFDVRPDQIKVVVHPESILHSAVEYKDGAIIGQMGLPDMHLPIQYALTYPGRYPVMDESLDFAKIGALTFEEPDTDTFKGLKLAYTAINKGGNMPTVYNAANEKAVELFLDGKIKFLDIAQIVERMMGGISFIENPNVDEIVETKKRVENIILEYI